MANETIASDPNNSPNKRRLRILAVLDECRRRRAKGETLTDEMIVAAYADLMPELVEEIRKRKVIDAAREQAFSPGSDVAATVEHTPGRTTPRGLQISCPHCSNFVEVVTDTPYEEISCGACGSSFSLVDRDEATRMSAPLKSIGRFDLISRLGVGGFGTVWKARDRDLDRTVAVKIPRRGQLGPAEIDQFFREARAAAQLRHRNIVQVHEVGREGDTLFIVSDLVRGVTLADRLTGKRVSMTDVVGLCIPISAALHHAHEQKVIHRDLKPSNIMIDEENQPLLTDFGLAKREIGEVTMTVDGQILGTPAYMSPEQAGGHGHWTDRRTDIYSFGVILFELLTGELPFRGNAQMQVHQRLTEDPPEPRKLNPHISRDLATICWKCLEREPGRRYSTAKEVGDEFQRVQRGEPIQARPLSRIERGIRWAQRKPMVATTGALVVFLGVFGPLAASVIYAQNRDLIARDKEREKSILEFEKRSDKLESERASAQQEAAVLSGKVKPSEFWPPQRNKPPRQLLLTDLLDHAEKTFASSLREGKLNADDTALGYLSLAMMTASADNRIKAKEYYELACNELEQLVKGHPEDPSYAQALAECRAQLAALNSDGDQAEVLKRFEIARKSYESLAAEHKDSPELQIEWLESELNSAMVDGYKSGARVLQVDQIKDAIKAKWPTDLAALYRLACFLAGQNPIISEDVGVKAAPKSELASPTNR